MKRIAVVLLFVLIGRVMFAQPADSTKTADTTGLAAESSVIQAVADTSEVGLTQGGMVVVSGKKTNILSIIALGIGALGLILAFLAFYLSKKQGEYFHRKYSGLKEEMNWLSSLETKSESQGAKLGTIEAEIERLKSNLNAIQVMMDKMKTEEKTDTVPEIKEPSAEKPRFVPRTFYGMYKPRYQGIPQNQLSEMRENTATLRMVTTSDQMAEVHIVEGLNNTQISSMIDSVLDVVEGNPQSFNLIVESAPGAMQLEDDVWVLKQRIQVKLH